jgi:aspartyl-tRNA(Asn)/glutamyl-tRNA(Gln) amidotransferase subunit A
MVADKPAAERDAPCVARASAAGLVAIGRTHMTEIAFSGLGVNPVTATAPNVHNGPDRDWAPGGSSSGAAASVAMGLAAAGIGSDTGGSVRIPSAWQNLVGLKTTHGLITLEGVVPLAAFLDTVGPLCRSVEDAAELTAVMAGAKAPDLSEVSLEGRRIFVDETVMLVDCEEAPLRAFEEALARLQDAGAEVTRGAIPEFAEALPLTVPILAAEAWAEWGEHIEAKGELMFHQIRKRTQAGAGVSAAEHIRAHKTLEKLRAAYLARTAEYDAVAMPSAAILPPSVSRLMTDDDYYERINLMALRNTRIANLLGLCSLTLPTPEPGCGFMFYAPPFTEGALCRLGKAAEPVVAAR